MEAADPEAEGNMPAVGICPALLSPDNGKPDDAEANADPSQDYNKKSPKAKTPMSTKHGERKYRRALIYLMNLSTGKVESFPEREQLKPLISHFTSRCKIRF